MLAYSLTALDFRGSGCLTWYQAFKCMINGFKLLNLFALPSGVQVGLFSTCLSASPVCVMVQITMTNKYFNNSNTNYFQEPRKHVPFTCHDFLSNSTNSKNNAHTTRYTLRDFWSSTRLNKAGNLPLESQNWKSFC